MHREIWHERPGNCPICGMAPEPLFATGEAATGPELKGMTHRLWIGLVPAGEVFLLEMGAHLGTGNAPPRARNYLDRGPIVADDAGGAPGRPAVLPAWLGPAGQGGPPPGSP